MQLRIHATAKRWRGVERPRWLRRGIEQGQHERRIPRKGVGTAGATSEERGGKALSRARIRDSRTFWVCVTGAGQVPKKTTEGLPTQQQPSRLPWSRSSVPTPETEVTTLHTSGRAPGGGSSCRTVRSLSSDGLGSWLCGRGAGSWHAVPLSGFALWRGTPLALVRVPGGFGLSLTSVPPWAGLSPPSELVPFCPCGLKSDSPGWMEIPCHFLPPGSVFRCVSGFFLAKVLWAFLQHLACTTATGTAFHLSAGVGDTVPTGVVGCWV